MHRKSIRRNIRLALCLAFLIQRMLCLSQAASKPKPIRLGIVVQSEGPNGLWAQTGRDLTKAELSELESLVKQELSKQEGVVLVSKDDPSDIIGLSIVVEKVGRGSPSVSFVASASLVISKKSGDDIFVTHDVIGGPDLASVARTVAFYFASARFRFTTGMTKRQLN